MKIAYIFATFPCRTETFALREIEGLSECGVDVTVLAAGGQSPPPATMQHTDVHYRPSVCSIQAILAMGYLLRRYPYGIMRLLTHTLRLVWECPSDAKILIANLHTIAYFARCLDQKNVLCIHAYFLSWPACIAMALAIATKRPFSIAAHARDIFVEQGALTLKVLHASFLTTCTRQGLSHLKANLPVGLHGKLYLHYHGIRTSQISCIHSSDEQIDRHIVAIGRLVPKKGFNFLLRALALLKEELPDCRLQIAGDGPQRPELIDLIRELDLSQTAELLGWQEPGSIIPLLSTAAVLAVPSVVATDGDRDGIPNVILEAFACGIPVVASNLEGISEVVRDGETGLLVEPGNSKQLASAIRQVLTDKNIYTRLSRNALQVVQEQFDLARNTKQLAAILLNA